MASQEDLDTSAAAFVHLAHFNAAEEHKRRYQHQHAPAPASSSDDPDLLHSSSHDAKQQEPHRHAHADMSQPSTSALPTSTGSAHSQLTAASSSPSSQQRANNSPFAKHLGRNRACQACRERKLKCDGQRPICGQCMRAWQNRRRSLDARKAPQSEYALLDQPCTYIDVPARPDKRRSAGGGAGGSANASVAGSSTTGGATSATVNGSAGAKGKAATAAAGGASAKDARVDTHLKSALAVAEQERKQLAAEVSKLKAQLGGPVDNAQGIRVRPGHGANPNAPYAADGMASSPPGVPPAPGLPLPPGFQATSDELSIAEILANTMRAGDGGGGGGGGATQISFGESSATAGGGAVGFDERMMIDPNLEGFVGGAFGAGDGGRMAGATPHHDLTGAAALHHLHGPPNMTGTTIYQHHLARGPVPLQHPSAVAQHHEAMHASVVAHHGPPHAHAHAHAQSVAGHTPGSQTSSGQYHHASPHAEDSTSASAFARDLTGSSTSPASVHVLPAGGAAGEPDPMLELVFSGWPKDFPPPGAVDQLVSIFFDSFSFLRCFHPGRFFASLLHGPNSPQYPHHSVLHTMFALAYTLRPELDPVAQTPLPAEARRLKEAALEAELQERLAHVLDSGGGGGDEAAGSSDAAGGRSRASNQQHGGGEGASRHARSRMLPPVAQHAKTSRLDRERAKAGSAGYHSARAVEHIQRGTWEGGNIYDVCRAAILLCAKKYLCGELLDAWMTSAQGARLTVALTLNWSRNRPPPSKQSGETTIDLARLRLLGPSKDWIEEDERRYTMYLAFISDRAAAATTLWSGSLVEEDVTVELPMARHQAWLNSDPRGLEHARQQSLHSPDLLTSNHIDSMNLMIKGMILLGRCGSYMCRLPETATTAHVREAAFQKLNNSITAFTMSFPSHLANVLSGASAEGKVDELLAMAHALPHLCTLLLHDPTVHLLDESYALCTAACTGVINILRLLAAVGADLALFPPIFSFALATAGKNLIRRMRQREALSQQGGGDMGTMRSEIDLILSSLCRIGNRWTLAMRQAQALALQLGMELTPELLGEWLGPGGAGSDMGPMAAQAVAAAAGLGAHHAGGHAPNGGTTATAAGPRLPPSDTLAMAELD